MTTKEKLEELRRRKAQALEGGGPDKVKKIHDQGRLSARERIELLLDPGTFQELGVFVTHRCSDFGMLDKKVTGFAS